MNPSQPSANGIWILQPKFCRGIASSPEEKHPDKYQLHCKNAGASCADTMSRVMCTWGRIIKSFDKWYDSTFSRATAANNCHRLPSWDGETKFVKHSCLRSGWVSKRHIAELNVAIDLRQDLALSERTDLMLILFLVYHFQNVVCCCFCFCKHG